MSSVARRKSRHRFDVGKTAFSSPDERATEASMTNRFETRLGILVDRLSRLGSIKVTALGFESDFGKIFRPVAERPGFIKVGAGDLRAAVILPLEPVELNQLRREVPFGD